MATVLGLILFCSLVVTLSIYRKWKIELEIEGLLWKIDPSDLLGYYNKDIVSSPSKVTVHEEQGVDMIIKPLITLCIYRLPRFS